MRLAIIGAGKMGEALACGILKAGLIAPSGLVLADVAADRVRTLAAELGATAASNNSDAVRGAEMVILAVKPYTIPAVCAEVRPALHPGAAVLSIAAGVTLATVRGALGDAEVVVARAMPNTPCLVGAGAIGLSFDTSRGAVPAEAAARVRQMLAPLGLVEEFPESQLDAVTGLSGSGPAYVAMLIEALADGGVLMGLPRAQAEHLAAQTVLGTAKLLLETGQHPGQLKDAVASPAGTTIAGIAALEQAGFRAAAIAAVQAAATRSRELG